MGVDPDVRRLVAPLKDMYRAGRFEIPHEAQRLSGVGGVLGDLIQELSEQSMLVGNPALFTTLIGVCSEVHDEMAAAVPSLNNAALAVVATAQDFERTDQDVESASELLKKRLTHGEVPIAPTPTPVPEPPRTGPTPEPTPTRPHGGEALT